MDDLRQPIRISCVAVMAALPLWLGACSSNIDLSQASIPKFDTSTLFVPNPTQFAPKQEGSKPVTPADLVDANGYCAGGAAPVSAQTSESGSDPGAAAIAPPPLSGRNIALQMTECEVIQAMGRPADTQTSANERGDRMVTMTYMTPERPTYRFVGGRLATIERGAEPPPPEAVRKKKPAPKRTARQAT